MQGRQSALPENTMDTENRYSSEDNVQSENLQKRRAFRISVKGRVQGVGFRYWTAMLAKKIGVAGWVRNCADYSVEIFAESDTETLGEFMYALKHNHPYAKVESLTSEELKVRGLSGFSVK